MSYHLSTHRGSSTSASQPFNPFVTKFRDHLLDGKDTVSLLEASPVNCKPEWKLRSFMHCEAKFRPKMSTHSAATIISQMGYHFNVNNHVASGQAENLVEQFKVLFANVDNLSPLGYFNSTNTNLKNKVSLTRQVMKECNSVSK